MTSTEPLATWKQRLRRQADKLLDTLEAMPMPTNYVEAVRAMRAVTVADSMLRQIYAPVSQGRKRAPEPDVGTPDASTLESPKAAPPPVAEAAAMNRQQRRHAEALMRKLPPPLTKATPQSRQGSRVICPA